MLEELLYTDHVLMDGYDKEACIYLSRDWNKFLTIRNEMADYDIRVLTYRKNHDALNYLDEAYAFVLKNPDAASKDYKILGGGDGRWGSSNLLNCALNHLWCKGKIGISNRKKNVKCYFDIDLNINKEQMDNGFDDFDSFLNGLLLEDLMNWVFISLKEVQDGKVFFYMM